MSKKILFLIDKVESGGAENVLIKIMENFQNKGNEIYFIPNLTIEDKYLNKIKETIHYINPNISISNIFTRIYSFIKYFFIILLFVKKEKPEYMISFLERSNITNIMVAKIFQVPSIISTRNNLTQQYSDRSTITKYVIKFLIKYFYNKSKMVIALSDSVKDDLILNFEVSERLIQTLYNPYDLDNISFLANKKVSENELPFIKDACITVGRLTEQKGHIFLIKSFALVVEKIPSAKLIILGEGELKDILQDEINNLKLSNNIYLLGYKNNPYKYIRNSKLFLFSSLWEGFGNALLEAMASGKAVVSTNCDSGPKEILSKNKSTCSNDDFTLAEYGILTPVIKGKKEEIIYANAIIKLLTGNKLRAKYEQKSLKRSEDFSNEKILKLWDEIILDEK